MATGLYTKGKENLGLSSIDLLNDDLVLILLDTTLYTVDLENDITQADIPTEAVISERSLTGKDFSGAIFDADDIVFPSLTSEQQVGAFAIAMNSGSLSTSLLVFYNDNAPEFPVTLDGTDFTVVFDNGPNKIFKL